jgi:hypothetical protein
MDSLYDLLSSKNFDEPPQIAAIKDYIRTKYNAEASVTMRENDILVVIKSSSLASRLRFDMPKLKESAKTDKRIVLRINS